MTLFAFTISIIQLPCRKGARYGYKEPNCHLKTKPKYKYEKKTSDYSIHKTWNSFRSFKHAKEILLYEYREYTTDDIDDIEFALPINSMTHLIFSAYLKDQERLVIWKI